MIFEIRYLSAQRRYRRNRSLEDFADNEYINGQALGTVSKMRYGLCPMSFNGCESIAVYNAMIYLGEKHRLCDIALRLERFRMFFGIIGCNPRRIGRVLAEYGADYRITDNSAKAEAFIISYWTGRRFLSSIHTVFCIRKDDGVHVFNQYNNSDRVYLISSAEELTGNRKPIAVYIISRQNHN